VTPDGEGEKTVAWMMKAPRRDPAVEGAHIAIEYVERV
jgi:hypothetical protein